MGFDFPAMLDKIAHKEFTVEYEDNSLRTFVTAPDNLRGTGMNINPNYILYEKKGDTLTEIRKAETRQELLDLFK